MTTEHHYLWRTKWNGKGSTTRYHCTEEQVRHEHPDAQRVEGSLIVREIPETDAEVAERTRSITSSSTLPWQQVEGRTKKV